MIEILKIACVGLIGSAFVAGLFYCLFNYLFYTTLAILAVFSVFVVSFGFGLTILNVSIDSKFGKRLRKLLNLDDDQLF